MATIQKKPQVQNTQDFIRIQDLLYLCLAKWHWFVLSLAVCLGVAIAYLLRTPPVYTRSASILIKDDSKGKSASTDMESFGDFGIFTTNTNVNNEMGTLQSPDLMREVVTRLHLEMNYLVEGRFHKNTIYGDQLPVAVTLADFPDNQSAAFQLHLSKEGSYILSDLARNGEPVEGEVKGHLGDTIQSPFGKMAVTATAHYRKGQEAEIEVIRSTIKGTVGDASSRLAVSQNDEKSNIISLSFQDVSIQRAEEVLNTLISVYNENWVKDKNQIAVSTSMFINERLGVIEDELGNVDNDISSYKSQHLLPDVQAAANMYMAQASEANAAIKSLNNQTYMARYIRNYLTSETNRFQLLPANSGIDNPNIASQINEYNNQLLERNNLVSKSSVKNPLVVEMDASLAAMRKALVSSIDNQLVALEAQIRSQQSYGGQATSQIASNPKQAKYLLSVERQQKVKESLYLYLLQKREENELSQAFTAYNTRIISQPDGSMLPTAPVKKNILLVAFALGLLIPVVIIFIRENTNTVVRGRKDLESLTVPIIGEIPQYFSYKRKWFFRRRVKPDTKAIVVKEGNRNVINEAFRVLRSNMDFMLAAQKEQNVFVITSFNPGSGKSFLAMNIAMSFAIKMKRVLVIDGDLRHGSTSSYVDSPEMGLSDYLSGITDNWRQLIASDERYKNFHILPIGKVPPNPTELLENGRLEVLIGKLRSEYDYIFIDCPPIDIVADAQILEKVADRTFFVIRAGLLDRSMLPELENIYQEKRFKNLSLILNGTESTGGRYSYRYGYRYGYHYGYASYYGSKEKRGRVSSSGTSHSTNFVAIVVVISVLF